MLMRDVAVIGAGPAGLYAAYRLASAGLGVTVLDAQERIGENAVCSGVIGEEAFVRFGLPVPAGPEPHLLSSRRSRRREEPWSIARRRRWLAWSIRRNSTATWRVWHVPPARNCVSAGLVEAVRREKHGAILRFRSRLGAVGKNESASRGDCLRSGRVPQRGTGACEASRVLAGHAG